MASDGQQHPLKIYFIMWGALFVLSAMSYATDFMDDGALRTFCILMFMMLKAGGIVWIFMHMGWERVAMKVAILMPPLLLMVLVWLMTYESDYTGQTRYAIRVNDVYPKDLDFPTYHELAAARVVLEWIDGGMKSGYETPPDAPESRPPCEGGTEGNAQLDSLSP